jgi:hypothetical protein
VFRLVWIRGNQETLLGTSCGKGREISQVDLNCRELGGEQFDSGGKAVIEGGEHCWFGKGIGIHVGGVKRGGVARRL